MTTIKPANKVKALGFVPYVALLAKAALQHDLSNPQAYKRALQRERLKAQAGLTDDEINALTIQQALEYKTKLDEVMSPSPTPLSVAIPKLLSPPLANGVTEPIRVQLGDPIQYNATTKIIELEFFAQTYMQLEDALVADTDNDRTIALLKIAKATARQTSPNAPNDPEPSNQRTIELQAVPSNILDQLTLQDGLFVLENVTPRFFDMPDN